jgi:hypothetical protein
MNSCGQAVWSRKKLRVSLNARARTGGGRKRSRTGRRPGRSQRVGNNRSAAVWARENPGNYRTPASPVATKTKDAAQLQDRAW